jgi:DNA polymerase-3 subunit gamma/tau
MAYQIFARKYRPKNFEEMVGQKPVVQTLQNAIKNNRVAQAYIFSGMRGIGKTTVARILAKALNCQYGPTPTPCNKCEFCLAVNDDRSVDVLEIDGASNRTVEEIGPIRDTAKYKPIHSRYKVIIIDEVHMLSTHAFNALLKTLEEPPERTVFIFATTEVHKVPATIVSRCQHFEFKKISQKEITNHLLEISQKENITISAYGLSLIAEAAEGSLRDAQSLLDQAVAFSGEIIRDEDLKQILGAISKDILFECSTIILKQEPARVFSLVEKIMEKGYDLRFFYKELVQHFRNLLLAKSVGEIQDLLPLSPEELGQLREEAAKASAEEILRCLVTLQQSEPGLRFSSLPQIYIETVLVKLCHFKKIVPLQELIQEVEKMRRDTDDFAGGGEGQLPSPGQRDREKEKTQLESPLEPAPGRPGLQKKEDEEKALLAKILDGLQEEKSSLAAILAQQTSFKIRDEALDIKFHPEKRFVIENPAVLEIAFPAGDDFYREAVRRDVKTVERIASAVLGRKVKVKVEEAVTSGEAPREKDTELALKDPSVQAFMDTFKAQILSIEPIKRTKGGES